MQIPKTIRLNANLIVMFKFANKKSVCRQIWGRLSLCGGYLIGPPVGGVALLFAGFSLEHMPAVSLSKLLDANCLTLIYDTDTDENNGGPYTLVTQEDSLEDDVPESHEHVSGIEEAIDAEITRANKQFETRTPVNYTARQSMGNLVEQGHAPGGDYVRSLCLQWVWDLLVTRRRKVISHSKSLSELLREHVEV
jgi:hypothetical protein